MLPDSPLPPLNVLQARSTIAAVLLILSLVAPELASKFDPDTIIGAALAVIDAVDKVTAVGSAAWLYLERKNPRRALSFFAPLDRRRVPA